MIGEISPTENRYLCNIRDIDVFVRAHYSGMEIVDHDFAPDHRPNMFYPMSLNDCVRRIDSLHEEIPGDHQNAAFIRRNLRSIGMTLGVLSGNMVIGENLDFLDYVEQTMGVRPADVPEDGPSGLAARRQDVEEALAELPGGFSYHAGDRDRFNTKFAIPAAELRSTIEGMIGASRGYVASIAGSTLVKGLDIVKFETVESEDTWHAYFGTRPRGHFFTQFNTNPLLRIMPSVMEAIQVHEMTHGVSSTNKQLEIARGRLSAALGVLIGPSSLYFQEEVAARAVEGRLLADRAESDPLARYACEALPYENGVATGMIIKANSGSSRAEVAKYGKEHLPYDEPAKVERDAELYAGKLLYKTVFAVDGEAVRIGRAIASLPKDEMAAAVVRLCTEPVPADEILAYGKLQTEE